MPDTPAPEPDVDEPVSEPAREPGFHVYTGKDHNSGPYLSSDDAQAFIDSHLDGKGTVKEVTVEE